MRWIEVCCDTPEDEISSRCEELTSLGAEGFVIESENDFHDFLENNHQYWDYVDEALTQQFAGASRIKFYLTDDESGRAKLAAIQARYAVTTSYVADSDWENNWRQYYQPIEVGEKLVVVPEWMENPDNGRLPLRLDPGLTFGTGSHATTRMCLTALERFAHPGVRLLDIGCGSGILGIGGLILGADSCVGCDIDPKSPDVAAANAALNGIGPDRFTVYAGNILSDEGLRSELGTGYPVVLTNIVSDVIIPLSAFVRRFMAPGGVFITSGVIEGRQDDVRAALERNGFTIESHSSDDDWHCFVCR